MEQWQINGRHAMDNALSIKLLSHQLFQLKMNMSHLMFLDCWSKIWANLTQPQRSNESCAFVYSEFYQQYIQKHSLKSDHLFSNVGPVSYQMKSFLEHGFDFK
jgi:hypothetical protein